MSPLELRASLSLASLFALRMLGLFLILPVFAVHAQHLPGGEQPDAGRARAGRVRTHSGLPADSRSAWPPTATGASA